MTAHPLFLSATFLGQWDFSYILELRLDALWLRVPHLPGPCGICPLVIFLHFLELLASRSRIPESIEAKVPGRGYEMGSSSHRREQLL